jgi:AcrR family transcriptional regulator
MAATRAEPLIALRGAPAASVPATSRRKDAERNRAAILAAARELFGSGRDVPMYEIGRRAGVGQATLYRHFPERAAIVAAITREHIERIEAAAEECAGNPQAVFIVLEAAAEMLVCIHDLLGILREDATLAPILNELRASMMAVLETTLWGGGGGAARRPGRDASDLAFVLKMLSGALVGVSTADERAKAVRRALEIATNGLRQSATAVEPAAAPTVSVPPSRAD